MIFYIIKIYYGMYTIDGTSQKGNCIQFIGTEEVQHFKHDGIECMIYVFILVEGWDIVEDDE